MNPQIPKIWDFDAAEFGDVWPDFQPGDVDLSPGPTPQLDAENDTYGEFFP